MLNGSSWPAGCAQGAHRRGRWNGHELCCWPPRARCIPTNQGGVTLRVRASGGSLIWEHTLTTPSVRYSADDGQASYVAGNNLSAGQELHFVLVNASGAARVAWGHITYGWGSLRV